MLPTISCKPLQLPNFERFSLQYLFVVSSFSFQYYQLYQAFFIVLCFVDNNTHIVDLDKPIKKYEATEGQIMYSNRSLQNMKRKKKDLSPKCRYRRYHFFTQSALFTPKTKIYIQKLNNVNNEKSSITSESKNSKILLKNC